MKKLMMEVNRDQLDGKNDAVHDGILICNVLESFIVNYAQQNRGLDFNEQKKFGRLWEKFNAIRKATIDEPIMELEMEEDEFTFLEICMKKARLNPSVLIKRVIDLVEAQIPSKINKKNN